MTYHTYIYTTFTFHLVFVCFFISFEKVGADDARGGWRGRVEGEEGRGGEAEE